MRTIFLICSRAHRQLQPYHIQIVFTDGEQLDIQDLTIPTVASIALSCPTKYTLITFIASEDDEYVLTCSSFGPACEYSCVNNCVACEDGPLGSGLCTQCAPGWSGFGCDVTCPPTCSQCTVDGVCDRCFFHPPHLKNYPSTPTTISFFSYHSCVEGYTSNTNTTDCAVPCNGCPSCEVVNGVATCTACEEGKWGVQHHESNVTWSTYPNS